MTRYKFLILAVLPILLAACHAESESHSEQAIWYEAEQSDEMPHAPAQTPDNRNTTNLQDSAKITATKTAADQRYGIGASLNGFRPFPENDPWNQDISTAEIDPQSDQILAFIGLEGHLHPDFGSGTWNGSKIGIPYIVVPGDQPRVTVNYDAYPEESDAGPFPIPFETPVEGDPHDEGDRHIIVIDRDNWLLYEMFRSFPVNGGASWRADSGAIFDLRNNTQRPRGWTSADAAGLPIFPGLIRYDEVGELQEIRHAIRFTLAKTRRAFVPPASHWASSHEHPLLPPLGMRVRLKADVPIGDFPQDVRIILTALKKYGMFLADNGSDWFMSGTPDERWDNDELRTLRKIKIGDLEILKMNDLVTPYSF